MSEEQTPLDKLSPQHRAFVLGLFLHNFNQTAAALEAQYSEKNAKSQGSKLRRRPDVQAAINQLLEENIMGPLEVESRIADMARASVDDFLEWDEVPDPNAEGGIRKIPRVSLSKAHELGKLHLLKRIKYDAAGQPEIELHDAQSALTTLAKRHGMLRDHVDITSSGQQLQALTSEREKLADLTPEQLEALYRASLDTS